MDELDRRHSQRNRGFTLIELLVVLFVMSLLTTVSVPLFAKFTQTSKVQQAAEAVDSALFQARSQAQNLRTHVAAIYGDDLKSLGLQDTPNIVPPPCTIEVWGVLGGSSGFGGYNQTQPWSMPGGPNDNWYPFHYTTKMLLKSPITVPAGVRIIAGYFQRYASGATFNCVYSFPNYRRDPHGEVKRHETVFAQTGGTARNDNCYAYNYILIFDQATGEHLVVEVGRSQSATRPRILPYQLTHIGGTKITNFKDINNLINSYPGNL